MKQRDLQPCICCGKGLMHNGDITFLRLRIEQMVVNVRAVQQQHGLEAAIGSPFLAHVMGPDRDLAEGTGAHEVLICLPCAMTSEAPFRLLEMASERDDAKAEATP